MAKPILWATGAASVSTAASATSLPIQIGGQTETGACLQLAWTGTTAGTVKLQASNDSAQWDDLDGVTNDAAGAAGTAIWVVEAVFFQYLRVVFTRSGGTGALSGTFNTKKGS